VVRAGESPDESQLDKLREIAREEIAKAAEPSVRSAVTVPETWKPAGRTLLDFFREAAHDERHHCLHPRAPLSAPNLEWLITRRNNHRF